MLTLQQHLEERLRDPAFLEVFDKLNTQFDIAEKLIEYRQQQGLSQAALARAVGTQQSAISRLENATYLPSLRFLVLVANALGCNVEVRITPR